MNYELETQSNELNLGLRQDDQQEITKKLKSVGNFSSCTDQSSSNNSKRKSTIGEQTGEAQNTNKLNICEYSGMWESMYRRLVDFQQQHGHCRVPYRYKDDPQLGAWVATQRRNYKLMRSGRRKKTSLSPKRELKLVQIGFEWSANNPRNVKEIPKSTGFNTPAKIPPKTEEISGSLPWPSLHLNPSDLLNSAVCRWVAHGGHARLKQEGRQFEVHRTLPSPNLMADRKRDAWNSNCRDRSIIDEHPENYKLDKCFREIDQLNSFSLGPQLAAITSGPLLAEKNCFLQRASNNNTKKYATSGPREMPFSSPNSINSLVQARSALPFSTARLLHESSFPTLPGLTERNVSAAGLARCLVNRSLMFPDNDIHSIGLVHRREEHANSLERILKRCTEKQMLHSNYRKSGN